MIQKIEEIQILRARKSELEKQETQLSVPLLSDLSLIDMLYTWFGEKLAERDCAPHIESVVQRKKFLFIILYLYSPTTLAGGKMIRGLRDKLAQVLELHSRTTISDNCADIVFLYNRYKYFKNEVNDLFQYLTNKLEETGITINLHTQ